MFDLITSFVKIPTVSGFETSGLSKLNDLSIAATGSFFHQSELSPVSGLHLIHHAKSKSAKKLILDAHIDTVGFVVSEITDGGFIRVLPVGGIDRRILPACEVMIYGKKSIHGVFTATPPHLVKKGQEDILPELSEFLIDTGFSKKELETLVSIGTPIGFLPKTEKLLNNQIISSSLDDKICAITILRAVQLLKDTDVELHVLFSSGEETSSIGVRTFGFEINADAAIVLDVNFAKVPDVPDKDCAKCGQGPSVSYSSSTSKRLTDLLVTSAKEEDIPVQLIVETKSTGTNAHILHISSFGTPCAVLSIPLKNMHTYGEIVSLDDVESAANILCSFIKRFEKEQDFGIKIIKGGVHGA